MKYYKELAKFYTFTLNDAMSIIGSVVASKKYLENMIKEGAVHRIKKNLYTCYNFAEYSDCANRFQIASSLNENSFVSYHSAFEFYGFYNQMYFEMQVSSTKKIQSFEYKDYRYVNYLTKTTAQVDIVKGARVSSIERTIVDSIDMLGKVMDIEELTECLNRIHIVDEKKIIEMLKIYDKPLLYKKVGYILSYYKDDYKLSDEFFLLCKEKCKLSNINYLVSSDKKNTTFNSEWRMYVYSDIRNIGYEGGKLNVYV